MSLVPSGNWDEKGLLRWGGLRAAVAMDADGHGNLRAINSSTSPREKL